MPEFRVEVRHSSFCECAEQIWRRTARKNCRDVGLADTVRAPGMSTSVLQEVYEAIVMGKLCYASSFISADHRQHLDGFIRRSVRPSYCALDLDIVGIIDQQTRSCSS